MRGKGRGRGGRSKGGKVWCEKNSKCKCDRRGGYKERKKMKITLLAGVWQPQPSAGYAHSK